MRKFRKTLWTALRVLIILLMVPFAIANFLSAIFFELPVALLDKAFDWVDNKFDCW